MGLQSLLFIICLGICIGLSVETLNSSDQQYLNDLFKNIPNTDRKRVLYHHLFLGYLKKNPQLNPSDYNLDDKDAEKLYDIFLTQFKTDSLLSDPICFSNGECIDPSDSGLYPS
ncbi:uncharacterized protein [Diabrotica undecimpunctata]|uniref:uncharacterized protein n=1 Tax=Diabrotica undecimpunctata TaxID=50387 RepID=UPI003B63EBFE